MSRSPEAAALRQLFLTLFLRGRSARQLKRSTAPTSVGSKLFLTLLFYFLVGALAALGASSQGVFGLSAALHGITCLFLGMFVAASGGEVLFNKEEADILLHRPIAPRTLLRAKIRVLVEVSLWLAGALNLAGLVVGTKSGGVAWLYPLVHTVSVVLEALFCTGAVVVVYQLCLRWFGRERLEGLMTAAQILVAVSLATAGQVLPHVMRHIDGRIELVAGSWWLALLPPAWFAALDDAVAGTQQAGLWLLAGIGLLATVVVLGVAFGKLASEYQRGLQTLQESHSPKRGQRVRRWFQHLVHAPPLRWWLRDPVARASFLLTAAYLVRDRDTKLRIYPGLAPMVIMPLVFLARGSAGGAGVTVALAGGFVGSIPWLALEGLQSSQSWRATDVFRAAPVNGPGAIAHGARRAVLFFLTLPVVGLLIGGALLLDARPYDLMLLVPGLMSIPVYALLGGLGADAVPFSRPPEDARGAGRGLKVLGVMAVSGVLSTVGYFARAGHWFGWFVLVEGVVLAAVYVYLRHRVGAARWSAME